MKALLLRIGIDSNYGSLSPVWSDMSYIYFPIYNKNKVEFEKGEKRTYKVLFCNKVKYLHKKIHDKIVHYDPEFVTFTYGDVRNKSKILSKLEKGDLLVFYMGGVMQNKSFEKGCFIIGYFEVEDKFIGSKILTKEEKKKITKLFPNNAHAISSKKQNSLVIIKGSKNSKKLDKCIKITVKNINAKNPIYITEPNITKEIGIRRFIVRAVPIKITDEYYLNNLKKLLKYN